MSDLQIGDRVMAVSAICPDKQARGQIFYVVGVYQYFYRCVSRKGWFECFSKDDLKHNRGIRRA